MIRCRVVRRANRKMLRQSRTAVEQFFTGLADRSSFNNLEIHADLSVVKTIVIASQ